MEYHSNMSLKLKSAPEIEEQQVKKKIQKTIVVWCDAGVKFFVIEGDYSHFHKQFLGSSKIDPKMEDAVHALYYDSKWGKKPDIILYSDFPAEQYDKETTVVIVTGNLL